ncbi:MAG: nuclear transport factor 2 family protein [Chromatiaceae bacterium]|nr:nuclear transport factor 2 family protein [Gammaproteobacteria bacterium]MCP5298131.1 nuclear transport factor 2 family protein [Chromatiaceae bacterium]MCP5423329.1 nuclear transport factor 2 family protein [Chromatiaceae bacterium]
MSPQLRRYVRFFEELDLQSLQQVEHLFAPRALFQDPFNRVRGPAAIRRIFSDLLAQFPHTRFQVSEALGESALAYLRWQFQPRPDRPLCIDGVSRVVFDDAGLVLEHIDYWDSSSQLFARLPVIGPPTRLLLRRFTAHGADQVAM